MILATHIPSGLLVEITETFNHLFLCTTHDHSRAFQQLAARDDPEAPILPAIVASDWTWATRNDLDDIVHIDDHEPVAYLKMEEYQDDRTSSN